MIRAMTSKIAVMNVIARTRGMSSDRTGSTPRTSIASSSSRILRAPRSAVTAVPTTPATTMPSMNGANSRMLANTKKEPSREGMPKMWKIAPPDRPGAPKPNPKVATAIGNQQSLSML